MMFQGSCDVWDKTAAIGIPGEGRKLRSQGASVGPLWSREEVALIAARCNCVSHTYDIILISYMIYIYIYYILYTYNIKYYHPALYINEHLSIRMIFICRNSRQYLLRKKALLM